MEEKRSSEMSGEHKSNDKTVPLCICIPVPNSSAHKSRPTTPARRRHVTKHSSIENCSYSPHATRYRTPQYCDTRQGRRHE